ncbi:MAG: hypothetical protein V4543_00255 [Bacteroidota bacterium]
MFHFSAQAQDSKVIYSTPATTLKKPEPEKDSKRQGLLFILQGGYGAPGGDMRTRFGSHGEAGAGVFWKTRGNWLFGVDGSYIFGEKVKENPVSALGGSSQVIFNAAGSVATLAYHERGFRTPVAKVGKLFHLNTGRNTGDLNGIVVSAGIGFFQHYIDIQDQGHGFLQVSGEYMKGYDRMRNGPCITQSIGWMASSNSALANFMLSFEFMEAFTTSNRYNFKNNVRDTGRHYDYTYGLRLSWAIPALNNGARDYEYY